MAHTEHRHETTQAQNSKQTSRDLGMMGVLIHVVGDAANNIGVITIFRRHLEGRL